MFSRRDLVIFFAGFEAFHTLSHIIMQFLNILPLHLSFMTLTQQFNFFAIIINAFITVGLLWWASQLK
jgi:hypothetical protein